jgi:hypothetical protein
MSMDPSVLGINYLYSSFTIIIFKSSNRPQPFLISLTLDWTNLKKILTYHWLKPKSLIYHC